MNGQVNGLAYEHNTTFVNHPLNRVIFWNTMYELSEFATNDKKATPSGNYTFESVDHLFDYFEQSYWESTSFHPEVEVGEPYCIFGELKNISEGATLCNNSLTSTQFAVLTFEFSSKDKIKKALQNINHYYFMYREASFDYGGHFRIQIIFPLLKSMSPEHYISKKVAYELAKKIGIADNMDKELNNPIDLANIFFLPQADGHEVSFYTHRGSRVLSLSDLSKKPSSAGVFNSKQVAANISGSDENEESIEAGLIVDKVFNGRLHVYNNEFYGYGDGIWRTVTKYEVEHHLAVTYYKNTESIFYVNKIIRRLRTHSFVDEFPKYEHNVVVLENYTINLNSFEILEHSYEHYAKNKLKFNYDEQANCPIWLEFLETIWGEDQDYDQKVALLQEYMGLSLTPITKFQVMLWLIGPGSNGKSVILDIVRALVGPENCSSVAFADLGVRFSTTQLKDKLVNIDPDMSKTGMQADSIIKKIVSGEKLTVENKGKDPFEMEVIAKLWAAANFLPPTRDNSHGFFRRVLILKFNRIIARADQDKNLTKKLIMELPGIFNWALDGLKRLQDKDDFTIPPSSMAEVDDYRISNNPVAQFHTEHLEVIDITGSASKYGTLSQKVFDGFKIFCREQSLEPISAPEFGKRLNTLGIKGVKSNGKKYYPVKVVGMDVYDKYR